MCILSVYMFLCCPCGVINDNRGKDVEADLEFLEGRGARTERVLAYGRILCICELGRGRISDVYIVPMNELFHDKSVINLA